MLDPELKGSQILRNNAIAKYLHIISNVESASFVTATSH